MDIVVVDSDKGNEADRSCLEESTSIFNGVEVQEPYVGMEFDSEEAARTFYVEYARRVGFLVRVMQRRRSGIDGRTLARRLGCNKQGFSPNSKGALGQEKRPRPSAREGCKATILVKMEKSGKWVVTRFIKDHNHPLIATANGFSTEANHIHQEECVELHCNSFVVCCMVINEPYEKFWVRRGMKR
ncbi:protein FAR1-RELATED SEQUENCE 5-like isoform X2 [Vicia villosa]|uniref:protein FAR1-RELATED SEQUENCE 5-like isoform X2 n=1 Tax=Vicia villosa TaxID=3911 RepID=UPI00273BF950|nr:protein FAR1-RELATED SEQUENCE 5-like isoform X2 [Vicia villosa]